MQAGVSVQREDLDAGAEIAVLREGDVRIGTVRDRSDGWHRVNGCTFVLIKDHYDPINANAVDA